MLGEDELGDDELALEPPGSRDRQSVFCVPVNRSQSAAVVGLDAELPLLMPELLLPVPELPLLMPLPLPMLEPLPPLLEPLPMLELEPPLPVLLPDELPCAPAPCASVNPIAAAPSAAARVFSFMLCSLDLGMKCER